jgi:hypothetical protein
MKIICENEKEYQELMEASKYLHDFSVWVKNKEGKTKVSVTGGKYKLKEKEEIAFGLNNEIPIVNFLQHLYLSKEDFPNKDKVVKIKKKIKNIEPESGGYQPLNDGNNTKNPPKEA